MDEPRPKAKRWYKVGSDSRTLSIGSKHDRRAAAKPDEKEPQPKLELVRHQEYEVRPGRATGYAGWERCTYFGSTRGKKKEYFVVHTKRGNPSLEGSKFFVPVKDLAWRVRPIQPEQPKQPKPRAKTKCELSDAQVNHYTGILANENESDERKDYALRKLARAGAVELAKPVKTLKTHVLAKGSITGCSQDTKVKSRPLAAAGEQPTCKNCSSWLEGQNKWETSQSFNRSVEHFSSLCLL